jgi:hypothetical protein
MIKKLFWFVPALFLISLSNPTIAQNLTIASQSSYIRLNSYNGIVTNNAFGVRVTARGDTLFLPNWNLTARVKGKIKNSEGKSFDLSKLRIKINHISSDGPSLLKIGTDNQAITLAEKEFPIIENSNAPIFTSKNDKLMEFYISFDIIIEGGDYLDALKSFNQYMLNMVFSIKDEGDHTLSQSESSILMQITPQAD